MEDRVDLNQTDTFLKTPLMIAAANGRFVIVTKLLDYGYVIYIYIYIYI